MIRGKRTKGIGRATAILVGGLLGVSLAVGCSDDSSGTKAGATSGSSPAEAAKTTSKPPAAKPAAPAEPVVDTRTPEELIAAGRSVYNANCIACHALDPTQDGALGPAVAGSSLELLRARIVVGDYPPGYEPKRPSRVMVPLPHLEPKLPELAAYLESLE